MKLQKTTAGVLVGSILLLAALAAWGDRLGMSPGALAWVQSVAGMVGAAVLAALPGLLGKLSEDKDGDGIADILEPQRPTQTPPRPERLQ